MLTHGCATPTTPDRLLVIGAGGFLGGAVVAAAQAAGIPVLGTTRATLDLLSADAEDRLAAMLRPTDTVLFVSAIAPTRTPDALAANITMARQVCAAWTRVPAAHLIYLSSDAVYADEPALVREATPPSPGSLHGVMHLAREVMLRSACKAPLAILRPSAVYGAGDPHNGYGPNRFWRQAAAGQEIPLFGNGEEMRDHIHVDDVAAMVIETARRRSAGVLNLVTGQSVSFRAVAEQVVAALRATAPIKPTPRQSPITHRHFDVTARIEAFPHHVPAGLAAGLAAMARPR